MVNKKKVEKDWKKELSPEEYHIMREGGTEPPYSGKYLEHSEKGMYRCRACGAQLFASDAKLNSKSGPLGLRGWPSFADALPGAVEHREDSSFGMKRTEVVCAKCGGHLGHVFDDSEEKTGKHFCVNSCALDFEEK